MNGMAVFDILRDRRNISRGVADQQLPLVLFQYSPQVAACPEAVVCRIVLRIVGIHRPG